MAHLHTGQVCNRFLHIYILLWLNYESGILHKASNNGLTKKQTTSVQCIVNNADTC